MAVLPAELPVRFRDPPGLAPRSRRRRPRRHRGRRSARRPRRPARPSCSPPPPASATPGWSTPGRPGVVTYSRKVFIPLTRLCRDRCHYCTFATVPHRLPRGRSSTPDEVLGIARAGAALGCKEALFTLGDRPEDRWPAAREWLEAPRLRLHAGVRPRDGDRGCSRRPGCCRTSTRASCRWEELTRLKPVAPSMGMMLETTRDAAVERAGRPALRLARQGARRPAARARGRGPGGGPVHHRDPRRDRRDAGRAGRVALRDPRGGPGVRARAGGDRPELPGQARHGDGAAADAGLRRTSPPRSPSPGSCSAPKMRLQAPPNLVGRRAHALLAAGVDDWGGVSPVTPDHVNPERPWPAPRRARRALDGRRGLHAAGAAHGRTRSTCSRGRAVDRPAGARRTSRALADPLTGLAGENVAAAAAGRGRSPTAGGGVDRPRRPARRRRHRGPHRRPPQRLRRRSTATGRRCATPRGSEAAARRSAPRPAGGDRRRRGRRSRLAADDPAALLDPAHERPRRWR